LKNKTVICFIKIFCFTTRAILDSNQWPLVCRARKRRSRVYWFSWKCYGL